MTESAMAGAAAQTNPSTHDSIARVIFFSFIVLSLRIVGASPDFFESEGRLVVARDAPRTLRKTENADR
jgi:hypothetical protein